MGKLVTEMHTLPLKHHDYTLAPTWDLWRSLDGGFGESMEGPIAAIGAADGSASVSDSLFAVAYYCTATASGNGESSRDTNSKRWAWVCMEMWCFAKKYSSCCCRHGKAIAVHARSCLVCPVVHESRNSRGTFSTDSSRSLTHGGAALRSWHRRQRFACHSGHETLQSGHRKVV